jgi:hypothetical protein
LFNGRVVDFVQVEFWDFTIFGRTYTTWPIFNVADVSVTVGFLIILFFHKSIFKHEEEPAAITPEGETTIPVENVIDEPDAELKNENLHPSIEDRKQDTNDGTSGTAENPDR